MPKVIFWNIQRQGGGVHPIGAEELSTDLFGLTQEFGPDVVVLCEGLKGLHKAMVQHREIPPGYVSPKVNKTKGTYKDGDTLRYVMMHRSTINVSGYLVATGVDRPAMILTWGGHCVMALHAPSVTSSTVPQTDQMKDAYTAWATDTAIFGHPPALTPHLIVGDLNMDASLSNKRNTLLAKFLGTSLAGWGIRRPSKHTHRNRDSGIYDTTLDWALCAPGINATVEAITGENNKRKAPSSTRGAKRQKTKRGYNDVDSEGDEDYQEEFRNEREPDHRPILVEW